MSKESRSEPRFEVICKNSRRLSAFTIKGRVIYCHHFDERMGFKLGVNIPTTGRISATDQSHRAGGTSCV